MRNPVFWGFANNKGAYQTAYQHSLISAFVNSCSSFERAISTRVIFYVRREVDLMKTTKVNAYIMHIFGKIELLSIHAA